MFDRVHAALQEWQAAASLALSLAQVASRAEADARLSEAVRAEKNEGDRNARVALLCADPAEHAQYAELSAKVAYQRYIVELERAKAEVAMKAAA